MVVTLQSPRSAWIHLLFSIFLWASGVIVESSHGHSLFVNQNTTLQLSRGLPVGNSPGLKPGVTVVCERVYIHGLSRFRNLGKFAHSLKAKVMPINSDIRIPTIEICFHRNVSIGVGMCSQGQWEKVTKGTWARAMSPFDHKLLDIRTGGSTLENLEVSIEEEFSLFRVVFLIVGVILMNLASFLSNSLTFYYGSAMAVGIILVILMILFQGMKLLPTGRKSSLAIFLYSSVVGFGTFLLRYVPGVIRSLLMELGINEDMYSPLAIFLLAFVVLLGAWLGFWVVRKLVLTEDGSVDVNTAHFVAWAIRILAAVMILQSSMDPVLGTLALLSGIVLPLLRRILRLRFLRHLRRSLLESPKKSRRRSEVPDSSPYEDSHDEYMYKMQSKEDFTFPRPRPKKFTLSPCKSSDRGFTRTPPEKLSDLHPSTFHTTPQRREYSEAEWDAFTKESTEKALEGLVASPDFSKWLFSNADRISVTPNGKRADNRQRRWLFWS
ncbi:nuclear envelope integral membrane protein 1 isoform X1 [Senna tora]|uniref:Nuclear envelope integral membrane protein 1 isoform X1 n=1 Tax=Senna tora TaxID=362788 RepID=A0A834STB6_9FABA|nr:nuclear envelope integral membrane protein 1 isoform X1 [Senna tora]